MNVLVLVREASVVASCLSPHVSRPVSSLSHISRGRAVELRTSHELEGLGNVSSELLGVGHLDVGHVGGVERVVEVLKFA